MKSPTRTNQMQWIATALGALALLLAVPVTLYAQFNFETNNGTITITGCAGGPYGCVGALNIPGIINGLPVTDIAGNAFAGSMLNSVTIPDSVTNIGFNAFVGCDYLTNVTLGNGVISIGDSAFEYCTGLTNAEFPDSLTSIGNSAFDGCTRLANVTFPDALASIGRYAFGDAESLTSVRIPDSVTSIGVAAFAVCFSLTNATIGHGVASIEADTFGQCFSLTSVTIPDSVTNIGSDAFAGCVSLASVTIPPRVITVGDYAFGECTDLSAIYFLGNAPTLGGMSVFRRSTNAIVYYMPGTANWGPVFGSRPTMLWNPQVQTSGASFGVRTNRFGFNVTGTSNLVIVVEACTNLGSPIWSPVGTNTLTGGLSYFSDSQWTNYPTRLYRLRSP